MAAEPNFNERNEQVEQIVFTNMGYFFKNFGGKEQEMRKGESGQMREVKPVCGRRETDGTREHRTGISGA